MALKVKTITIEGVEYGVLSEGKVVHIDDIDGKELAFDADGMRIKIAELSRESGQHRTSAKEKAELLEKFGDAKPEDVAALRTTLEELGGMDGIKKLKEKSGIDIEAVKKSITDAYEGKLSEANKSGESKDATIRQLLVGNGFATSKSLEGTIFKDTRDVAESYFGKHFKVENGKPVAYLGDNMLLSRERPGEPADVNEALSILISQHPQRDSFLLASGGGSGAQQGNGSGKGGDGKTITRAEFTAKSPAEQSALAIARVQITD